MNLWAWVMSKLAEMPSGAANELWRIFIFWDLESKPDVPMAYAQWTPADELLKLDPADHTRPTGFWFQTFMWNLPGPGPSELCDYSFEVMPAAAIVLREVVGDDYTNAVSISYKLSLTSETSGVGWLKLAPLSASNVTSYSAVPATIAFHWPETVRAMPEESMMYLEAMLGACGLPPEVVEHVEAFLNPDHMMGELLHSRRLTITLTYDTEVAQKTTHLSKARGMFLARPATADAGSLPRAPASSSRSNTLNKFLKLFKRDRR
ncbi:protein ORF24 [Anguillid herpesvirus 1]|uniref:Protein ORF24 n=1 Tax=Anguillid herpesvirus 1 TaxID=150286 RepID=A0A1J0RE97_9VIRU|nr:protein ORF24 [Anguillid herpesvirus 1]ADA57787.1 protein ORF24 [Anguillid herpesvirus 1]APD76187.1 ORF24 [Anguillid herpesvirus 1]QRM16319.1 protein ORF24 [Anguillid herpesvirus 1]QRM16449.1 protein ORF24 [Anguillid herpesvirus 1]QRM16578.1 protein ORF24 [Anguillid herpesvirus 1]